MVMLLLRKMKRDIRRSLSSYMVAAIVVAVGFAGYSVLSNAVLQLEESKQYFFEATAFCDGFAEVQQAPLSVMRELEKIEGVRKAQGRIVKNIRVLGTEQEAELKLMSITEDGFNLPMLSKGMMPESGERQLVLGDGFSKAHGLAVGDTIALSALGREAVFTITGTGISPENIYLVKSINELLPMSAAYDAAFMDYSTMAQLYSMEGRANNIAFSLENGVVFADVEQEIEAVLKPYGAYRVYENVDELSVSVLEMEIEQLGKVTTVIPMMFLGIAAIILYITLHRLIEQQRTQIGTLMALGVPSWAIHLHYTGYGAVVGFAGGFAGGVYGSLAAGPMADFYRVFFSLPDVSVPISWKYVVMGTVASTVFCAVVGGLSSKASGRLLPAQALRPAPPKTARHLFLEWIPGFSASLTIPGTLAVRSIARNPKRSMLSLFGIACAYMITATLVSMNTMFDVFLFDFLEETQRQDITVAFSAPVSASDAKSTIRTQGIEQLEGTVELPVKLRGKQTELDGLVQGIEENSLLCRLYDEEGTPVFVQPNGIVISLHMAGQLGVQVGDYLEVEVAYPQKRITQVPITGIIAQYMGSNAYMSLHEVGRISAYRDVYTSVLLKAPLQTQTELLAKLENSPIVSTVQNRQQKIDQYSGMMGSISGIMAGMAVMGVLIGFAVIYVSSLISFEELKREMSVMRMLGLTDKECMGAISLSGWLMTSGAVVLGVPMTMAMSSLISNTMALEMFSIPNFVDGKSLVLSIGLIAVAVAWSNHAVFKKLKKTTPVELLRERE